MDRNAAYLAGLKRSEQLRDDGYRAADQLHADVLDEAHRKMLASPRNLADARERDKAGPVADDARAAGYEQAERDHEHRRAALAFHFDQFYRGRGNPAAAAAFLASVDGGFAPSPIPAPTPTRKIEVAAGVVHEVGGVMSPSGAFSPIALDATNSRETFTGTEEDFAAAKRFAVMTPKEAAEAEAYRASLVNAAERPSGRPAPPDAMPKPEPTPPPGLLADIAAALARTAK